MGAGIIHNPNWCIPKHTLNLKHHHHHSFHISTSPSFPRSFKFKPLSNSLQVLLLLLLVFSLSLKLRLLRWKTFLLDSLILNTVCVTDFQSGKYKVPKPTRNLVADWVGNNDGIARSLPIYFGGFSLLTVLLNRAVSGIAPVADASSSQSRADLLALGLAVTNILTGLVWLSIRPKSISKVDPEGIDCCWISPYLPDYVTSELEWFWQSLSTVTCCRSLVIVYDGVCILQVGVAAKSSTVGEAENVEAGKLIQGTLYGGIMKSGSQSYLANLSLYPGKSELPFLPPNTQAVILQPLGDKGIAVIGGDTIRGFTTADQAWVSLIGDKLDATLTKSVTPNASLAQDKS